MTNLPFVVIKLGSAKPWIRTARDEKSARNLAFAYSIDFWGGFSVVRVDGEEPQEIACYSDGRKFKNYVTALGGKPEHVNMRKAIADALESQKEKTE